MQNQTINYIYAFINNSKRLKRQEKEILINRFRNKTLKEIAQGYKYKSGESIRSIESRALYRLFGFILNSKNKIIGR